MPEAGLSGDPNGVTMQVKHIYLNDTLVGQASTWAEVNALLRAKGVRFLEKPAAAEGPTGFYMQAVLPRPLACPAKADDGAA